MVKAMSMTESLMYTASKIWGKTEAPARDAGSVSEMMALVDEINGGTE